MWATAMFSTPTFLWMPKSGENGGKESSLCIVITSTPLYFAPCISPIKAWLSFSSLSKPNHRTARSSHLLIYIRTHKRWGICLGPSLSFAFVLSIPFPQCSFADSESPLGEKDSSIVHCSKLFINNLGDPPRHPKVILSTIGRTRKTQY